MNETSEERALRKEIQHKRLVGTIAGINLFLLLILIIEIILIAAQAFK